MKAMDIGECDCSCTVFLLPSRHGQWTVVRHDAPCDVRAAVLHGDTWEFLHPVRCYPEVAPAN